MNPPKKIDIIIQPLRSAEGTKHEYISVEALKGWIKKEDAKLEFAGIVRIDELLKFIE